VIAFLAGALAFAAVYVLIPAPRARRLWVDRKGKFHDQAHAVRARFRSSSADADPRLRALVPALAGGVIVVVVWGPFWGALAVVTLGLLGLQRRRKKRLAHDMLRDRPALVDLLSATLVSGAVPIDALHSVGTAWSGAWGRDLVRVSAAMRWGASMDEAWTHVQDPELWRPVREAFVRSARTGAPVVDMLSSAAREMRREHREHVEVAAQSAGVRVVMPLALCFLPAYLLWGIVPIVMSWGSSALP